MTLLKPGDMFGEMVAFSSQFQWPSTIQAQESCKAFFLGREKIVGECKKMCPWHRMLIQNMLRIISERALILNKKIEYLSIKSLRGKISAYLLEQYKNARNTTFTLPLNRNELAEFLNVSRPSMSREICRMRDEGIIDFHLSTVRIIDVEALKNMLNS
ncbi:MAG: family transcriptional regulator, dissimilatory nitrate respiration regulator [Thermosediminibacterales bacterium]|nr:family transcriptional regulator, dissimilatory nitrate respiration regulator [Thermosediminibacterales bacterium]